MVPRSAAVSVFKQRLSHCSGIITVPHRDEASVWVKTSPKAVEDQVPLPAATSFCRERARWLCDDTSASHDASGDGLAHPWCSFPSAGIYACTNLQSLSLKLENAPPAPVDFLALASLPRLGEVRLEHYGSYAPSSSSSPSSSNYSSSWISSKHIEALSHLPHLTSLALHPPSGFWHPNSAEALSYLPLLRNLKGLSITWGNASNTETLRGSSEAAALASCEQLSLQHCLARLTQLQHLDLKGAPVLALGVLFYLGQLRSLTAEALVAVDVLLPEPPPLPPVVEASIAAAEAAAVAAAAAAAAEAARAARLRSSAQEGLQEQEEQQQGDEPEQQQQQQQEEQQLDGQQHQQQQEEEDWFYFHHHHHHHQHHQQQQQAIAPGMPGGALDIYQLPLFDAAPGAAAEVDNPGTPTSSSSSSNPAAPFLPYLTKLQSLHPASNISWLLQQLEAPRLTHLSMVVRDQMDFAHLLDHRRSLVQLALLFLGSHSWHPIYLYHLPTCPMAQSLQVLELRGSFWLPKNLVVSLGVMEVPLRELVLQCKMALPCFLKLNKLSELRRLVLRNEGAAGVGVEVVRGRGKGRRRLGGDQDAVRCLELPGKLLPPKLQALEISNGWVC